MQPATPIPSKHNTGGGADQAPPPDWPRLGTPEELGECLRRLIHALHYRGILPTTYAELCDLARELLREPPAQARGRR